MKRLLLAGLLSSLALLFGACQSQRSGLDKDSALLRKTVENDWPNMTWEEILAEAYGQIVNWYHWGGQRRLEQFHGCGHP